MTDKQPEPKTSSRRGFLQASALTAGGVAAVAAPALVNPAAAGAVPTDPSTSAPAEPITAYLRDAASSEVTVMSGTAETTFRDPVLAKRLLAAARHNDRKGR